MERKDEPLINKQIISLFLEKLEKFTKEERKEILFTIKILNHPIYKYENTNSRTR